MIVDVQGVSVRYGDIPAIAGVSFRLQSGTLTVLLGQSGSGKTTLLQTLRGQLAANSGAIRIEADGRAGGPAIASQQRRTGWVSQDNALIGRLTCLGNVVIGRLGLRRGWAALGPFRHADREAALEALEDVGMLDFALRRADTLSGGERRRVAIARALVSGNALMLGDEITTGLDPRSAAAILDLVRSLCREHGLTAVLSSHDVGSALTVADRVLALKRGRLVLDAAAPDVCERMLRDVYGEAGFPPSSTAGADRACNQERSS